MKPVKHFPVPIVKDLDEEAHLADSVVYRQIAGPSRVNNFRSPDFYVFLLFEKCSGTHSIDFVEYKEKDLQVHISFPGQIHSWNTGPDACGHKLFISKHQVEAFLFETQFSYAKANRYPVIDISQEMFEKLDLEFKAVQEEVAEASVSWDVVTLRAQLIAIMINQLVEEQFRKDAVMRKTSLLLLKFNALMGKYFLGQKSVNYYAKQLSVTSSYLSALCKKQLGVSAKELIDQRVLLEAKRLLQGSDMTIKEIAYHLGFSEMAYFSNYIKSKTGFYPRQFREPRG
ncbi:helix-turn-helix domain-containing protein [Niabella beijingensis]|uniref:helix-turn-helix domain-containing protein n=1 Tax=Niabella beijingensis TaxID=2872700 RepID=UPI001CBF0C76|nr:helix-turn-helix domain-containing protein [Niabella beijingensis]MBZ4192254.1 helix-turn-helix domain-containing protein [Niabella beijingensis]